MTTPVLYAMPDSGGWTVDSRPHWDIYRVEGQGAPEPGMIPPGWILLGRVEPDGQHFHNDHGFHDEFRAWRSGEQRAQGRYYCGWGAAIEHLLEAQP